jgi:hypothetical protein
MIHHVKVKYFNQPAYTTDEWRTLNPWLKAGQVGVVLDDQGKAYKTKIGPGYWNEIVDAAGKDVYIEDDKYTYDSKVTNPLGDIVLDEELKGDTLDNILNRILSPFVQPQISSASNDADGTQKNIAVIEIGTILANDVEVAYNVSPADNLAATDNIFLDSDAPFGGLGVRIHTGNPLVLTLANPLEPTDATDYNINVTATGSDGKQTAPKNTKIRFSPTILWGVSDIKDGLFDFDPARTNPNPFNPNNKLVSSNYKNTHLFGGNGYSYVLIPQMLHPNNIAFTEVTNPNQPSNYSMIELGEAIVFNGIGTYSYVVYRSEFSIIFSTKLKVL